MVYFNTKKAESGVRQFRVLLTHNPFLCPSMHTRLWLYSCNVSPQQARMTSSQMKYYYCTQTRVTVRFGALASFKNYRQAIKSIIYKKSCKLCAL